MRCREPWERRGFRRRRFLRGGLLFSGSLGSGAFQGDHQSAFSHLISGSFGSWSKVSRVLNVWIPLTLCSLGLVYAFRSGLWNIGVEGQMVLGAIGTAGVLRMGLESGHPLLLLCLALTALYRRRTGRRSLHAGTAGR